MRPITETPAPQTLPAQPAAAPQQFVLPNGLPLTAEVLSGQSPVDMAHTPVIIVMPSGWDPNGGSPQFALREISREVPLDYWPMSSRNPMGGGDDRGVFKWPKVARTLDSALDEPRTLVQPTRPADAPPAQAAILQKREEKPLSKSDEESKGVFSWWDWSQNGSSKALLATDGSSQPAPQADAPRQASRPKSKALFSFWNRDKKDGESQTPAPQLAHRPAAASQPPRMQAAATRAVGSPAVDVRRAAAAVPVDSSALAEPARPQLKWRAKGSSALQTVADSEDRSINTVASHTEPAATVSPSTPQSSTPLSETTMPATQPAATPPAAQQPATQAPAPGSPQAAAKNHQALLPTSLFGPHPLQSEEEVNPAIDQRAMIPSLLARVGLDKLPMRLPEEPEFEPAPARNDRIAAAPRRMPTRDIPPVVAVHGPPPARATQSYYAPPVEYYVPARPAARKQVTPAASTQHVATADPTPDVPSCPQQCPQQCPTQQAHCQCATQQAGCQCATQQAHCQCRQMPQPAAPSGRFARRDDVPPLAKPFWMLSEMTKFPRFVAAVTGEPAAMQAAQNTDWLAETCQCRRCRQMRAAGEAAAPRDARQVASVAAPDAAAETTGAKPSRRRPKTTATAKAPPAQTPPPQDVADTGATKAETEPVQLTPPAQARPVPPAQPRPPASSAVAIYAEPGDATALASDRAAGIAAEAKRAPRFHTTRIRNKSGTSVLIYNPGGAETTANVKASADRSNPLR